MAYGTTSDQAEVSPVSKPSLKISGPTPQLFGAEVGLPGAGRAKPGVEQSP